MMNPDSTYTKPFLTLPEQIRRLRERGMDCGSEGYASSVLERYGYYRLSGYWHPYRDRPRTRVGGAAPRPRRCSSALEYPSPVCLAAGTALLWCRHGALSAPGVQSGGDQPGQHAARCRKHQVIAWFLGDTQAIGALISSFLDTSDPTTPANRLHRHAAPPKQPIPQERHVEAHE